MVLIAATTAVALQAFRVLFPEGYGLAGRSSNQLAGVLVVIVFATALVTPAVRHIMGTRGRTVAVVALGIWRIAVLAPEEVPLALAVAGGVIAVVALSLVLTAPVATAPPSAAAALLAGLGADAAVRGVFATWDPVWQRTPASVVVGVLLAAGLAVAAWRCRGDETGDAMVRNAAAGVAVGAVLVAEVLFLISPGFVASSAGVSLSWAVLVTLGAAAVALLIVPAAPHLARGLATAGGAVFASAAFVLPRVTGAGTVVAVVVGQAAAGMILGRAAAVQPRSRRRAEFGLAGGWLLFALAVLLYQLHFDQPLPFDNRWVVTAAAALAAVAVIITPTRVAMVPFGRHGVVTAAVVAGTGVVLAAGLGTTGISTTRLPAAGRPLRIVEWNIRQAVGNNGDLAPDAIATELTRGGTPDVVVLPETPRGWPVSADLDLASWLSRRLDMPFVWSPAADNQFGTLVLSRLPVQSSHVIHLPVAGRAQGRSVAQVTLDAGDGPPITVLATHLQAHNDATSVAVRAREISIVLQQWAGAPRTIVIGDLNPRQGDPPLPARRPGEFPEIRAFLDAGFTTAQELTGCSHPTSGRNCSDFILVTPDLAQRTNVEADDTFDHRPVVSTISVRG